MLKLPRTIRLDPSDTFVFERAAEPGEWAVSAAFVFFGVFILCEVAAFNTGENLLYLLAAFVLGFPLLAMIISAPMLVIGLVVGIVISVLQSLTQIQEQTLTFVPKIVAMIAAAIVLMPWLSHRILEYSAVMFKL